jgi:hypothetical protein
MLLLVSYVRQLETFLNGDERNCQRDSKVLQLPLMTSLQERGSLPSVCFSFSYEGCHVWIETFESGYQATLSQVDPTGRKFAVRLYYDAYLSQARTLGDVFALTLIMSVCT